MMVLWAGGVLLAAVGGLYLLIWLTGDQPAWAEGRRLERIRRMADLAWEIDEISLWRTGVDPCPDPPTMDEMLWLEQIGVQW